MYKPGSSSVQQVDKIPEEALAKEMHFVDGFKGMSSNDREDVVRPFQRLSKLTKRMTTTITFSFSQLANLANKLRYDATCAVISVSVLLM